MAKKESSVKEGVKRFQPVIAVLGHVDHGKSSLLDYIRKSNVVEGEAGGITQRISAYEVNHKNEKGEDYKITFLDTPGHEAFQSMRERGVEIADIAILVVSAEDGVKAQTLEAWKTIEARKIPCVVAINKIDKGGADVQRTKNSLTENAIYIEGYGGDIPAVEVSAKTGQGIDTLLETLLLVVEMNEFTGKYEGNARGVVLESFVDTKRGISATLIIKEGTLPTSGSIVAGTALSPIRIVEDFLGKTVRNPTAGQAIKVTGFTEVPQSGSHFVSSDNKKEMESLVQVAKQEAQKETLDHRVYRNAKVVIPVIVKADSLGTLDAVKRELKKRETDDVKIKIIGEGVGAISGNDILLASSDEKVAIIGFSVKLETNAKEQAERFNIVPQTFDVIYKLAEWFDTLVEDRLPFEEKETILGSLKIIKIFSSQKDKYVIGGRVETGIMQNGAMVKIMRRGFELGKGKIVELQSQKIKTDTVQEGTECGLMIETKTELIPSDVLEAVKVEKVKL
jgi:translation initiation factor IF-2